MRNENYYRSVVKEFFPKDADKYRDVILSNAHLQDLGTHEGHGSGNHQCFCNHCGDDLSQRAQDLAQKYFDDFKHEFEQNQKSKS